MEKKINEIVNRKLLVDSPKSTDLIQTTIFEEHSNNFHFMLLLNGNKVNEANTYFYSEMIKTRQKQEEVMKYLSNICEVLEEAKKNIMNLKIPE